MQHHSTYKSRAPWNWFRDEGDNLPAARRDEGVLSGVHREIDRAFDDLFSSFGGSGFSSGFGEDSFLSPSVDIRETDREYKISVEVPGVEEKDIELEFINGALVISGEKKDEKEDTDEDEQYHSLECSYGCFRRVLSLPEDADNAQIDAKFKNGVLHITVPRREIESTHEETRRIKIH